MTLKTDISFIMSVLGELELPYTFKYRTMVITSPYEIVLKGIIGIMLNIPKSEFKERELFERAFYKLRDNGIHTTEFMLCFNDGSEPIVIKEAIWEGNSRIHGNWYEFGTIEDKWNATFYYDVVGGPVLGIEVDGENVDLKIDINRSEYLAAFNKCIRAVDAYYQMIKEVYDMATQTNFELA